ncbi:MAG: cytochrome c3 family protein, partial [Planctomycetota bacterium]
MSEHKSLSKSGPRLTIAILVVAVAVLCIQVSETISEECPFEALWLSSGHADANSEAFTHWDDDIPPDIPTRCAKCHSTPGFEDFLGVDGSAAGTVDHNAPIGTVITCTACHNEATRGMDSVTFPSGVEISAGDEARCMQCHQGRQSTVSVNEKIAEANVPDDDTVSASLSFRNIHYAAAGATKMGGITMGGYQYAGKSYDAMFVHVEEAETCIDCHDPHSLEVDVGLCSTCHAGVASIEDAHDIRVAGSGPDYDGDTDTTEGVYHEIEDLKPALYGAIQAYAADTIGVPIVYDPNAHPYWFNQSNGTEYASWTARLVRATYNYQVSMKDHGGYAHGGKYIIQLLYDSIEDLDAGLVAGLSRIDAGHFAGSEEAWRHWDEDGKVGSSCSKCHSATGLPFLLEEGVSISQPLSNGLQCSTCHDAVPGYTRHAVESVEFPSGAELDTGDPNSNLCISCHQGRESTVSVNETIAGLSVDSVSGSIGFKNIHYYAAGATLFGTEAKGAYEYVGKTYSGRLQHISSYNSCIECHSTHEGNVKMQSCTMCHAGITGPEDIRMDPTDYDGDSDTDEGLAGEVDTFHEALYSALQDYGTSVCGTSIVYDSHSYPYFFIDTNGNGQVDPGEATYSNKYNAWTPRLLQAAYDYQYVMKDPGGFAHNGKYIIQVLYDSLES